MTPSDFHKTWSAGSVLWKSEGVICFLSDDTLCIAANPHILSDCKSVVTFVPVNFYPKLIKSLTVACYSQRNSSFPMMTMYGMTQL